MDRRASALVFCVLLLSLLPMTNAELPAENIVSPDSTYTYEENYGVLLSPERAIDSNTSDDNYTRIITWCEYYSGSIACEPGISYIRLEYTLMFSQNVDFVNLTTISKTGYLSYGDPWGLEMSITVFHKTGVDELWSDNKTPGYMNSSTWQLNNSGPIPVRDNGTIGLEFFIQTDPFYVIERDVEIRVNEIYATPVTWGCKHTGANNYDANATDDDGSCDYDLDDDGVLDADEVNGCTDAGANNYDANATEDDGSCDYDLDNDGVLDADEVDGCTDGTANNYVSNATDDDGSCDYDLDDDGVLDADEVDGCTDETANNYISNATDDNGSCDYDLDDDGVLDADEVNGCTDAGANNYDANSTDGDGSCDYDLDDDGVLDADEVNGCMDVLANNFQTNATDEDGSCDYDLDDDGVLDDDDKFPFCDDNGIDNDGDMIPDTCDEFLNDTDNDGYTNSHENLCQTDESSNSSTPMYSDVKYCGDRVNALDAGKYCMKNGFMEKNCLNLWFILPWWNYVGLLGAISILTLNTQMRKLLLSAFKGKETRSMIESQRETRKYIEDRFKELEQTLIEKIDSAKQENRESTLSKIKLELNDMALELKRFIDDKHTQDMVDEKISGDPRIFLHKQVEESKDHALEKLIQTVTLMEEE